MFELLYIMYLSFNHILEVMKNTTYIEKCLEFDVFTYILTFTKGVLYPTLRKNRVLLEKGVFYWASKSEKGWVFFVQNPRKRGCFSKLGTSMVYTLVRSRGAGLGYSCVTPQRSSSWGSQQVTRLEGSGRTMSVLLTYYSMVPGRTMSVLLTYYSMVLVAQCQSYWLTIAWFLVAQCQSYWRTIAWFLVAQCQSYWLTIAWFWSHNVSPTDLLYNGWPCNCGC